MSKEEILALSIFTLLPIVIAFLIDIAVTVYLLRRRKVIIGAFLPATLYFLVTIIYIAVLLQGTTAGMGALIVYLPFTASIVFSLIRLGVGPLIPIFRKTRQLNIQHEENRPHHANQNKVILWAVLIHFSVGWISPLFFIPRSLFILTSARFWLIFCVWGARIVIILPIVIWLMIRRKIPGIDSHGKNITNWVISRVTYLIFLVLATNYLGPVIGADRMWLFRSAILMLSTCNLLFSTIGGIKAYNGRCWKYPFSIPLLK